MNPVIDKLGYLRIIVNYFELFTIVSKSFIFLGFLDPFCTVIPLLQNTNDSNTTAMKEVVKKVFYRICNVI